MPASVTRQQASQHLGAVRLHREVAEPPGIGIGADGHAPAEHRRLLALEQGMSLDGLRPRPEPRESGSLAVDDLAGGAHRHGDLACELSAPMPYCTPSAQALKRSRIAPWLDAVAPGGAAPAAMASARKESP